MTSVTITGDNNSSNLIVESPSALITLSDLSSSTISSNDDSIVSISTVNNGYGDQTIVHCLEEFTCITDASAAQLCQQFQTIGAAKSAYGVLRFTLWQGIDADTSNIAFCVRTFINERAASNAYLALGEMVYNGEYDTLLNNVVTNIKYIFIAQPSDINNLKATLEPNITNLMYSRFNIETETLYFSGVPGFTKLDTMAAQTVTEQNDYVICSERFTCSSPADASVVAAGISTGALAAYNTSKAAVEWQIGAYGNDVWCLRNFVNLADASAAFADVSSSNFFGLFPSINAVDVYIHLPGDSGTGKDVIQATGYETYASGSVDLQMYYLKETITDPVSGQQPKFLV